MQHIHSNCKTSSSFKPRNNSTASLNKAEDNDEPLMPSCLPNASPTDVVNYWLKNIPIVRPLYQMDDEFCEQHDETLPHMPAVKEEGCFQNETGEQSEKPLEMRDSQELGGPEGADPVIEDKNTICYAKLPCNETFQTIVGNSDYSHLSAKITKRESLANNCQSSIQVMKVLLSPKLDRCNSLPEISPTYGIKLSTSAKGLLDCLANLQVFDPDPKIYDKYSEIISTLQSLWSNRPCETVQDKHKTKVYSAEDEFNPRSSSGVDLSSGSIGSGKGSINGGFAKSDTAPGRTTIIAKPKAFPQIQEDAIMRSGCDSLTAMPENINTFIVSSNPITPDIAERVRCSPEHEKLNEEAQEDEGLKATDDVIQTPEPIKDIKVIALTFSQNDGNVKAAADKETNPPENSKLRTPSSDQRSQLTKRISQDPDPVWVLSLLKKLEKQFMSHYANAISEFKVKWDLNDNEMLDIMISELKEEVHKRIQSTISRELQKIQSRAGRTPRPPISILSRDSTMQTEQRRRRLKVMQNKLMTPSKSDEINTASGTEISDQRSEDEYCPCDTCMKKKMPSRVIQCAEAVSMAPVVKDYDLRQILQAKKDSSVTLPMQSKLDVEKHQIGGSDSSNSQGKNPLMMVKEVVITEHGVYACGNPDKHVGLINDAGLRTVKKGLSREEDYGQPEKEKVFDNRVDEADNGRSKTEQEKHKVEEGTDKKNEEEAEEDSEGDIAIENPPNELYAKRKEKESSKTEAGEGNPVEEKESNDERPEEELSAGEANKKSETLEAEEEEKDRIEKKAETPEEGKESENRTGEETKSVKEAKTFEDESEEAENSNVTSDEETQDDAPAAAPEAKPGNNKITKVIEGERTEEFGATQKSEANTTPENSAGEIQSDSTEAENEVGKESHENKGKMYTQKPTKKKDSISAAGQLVSEEEEEEKDEQADCRSVKRIQTDMRARSIENQAEDPGNQSRVYGDESDCNLIKQRTKTSIESQTGSLEHFKDLTMKEKLQDIQSFMESLSDQDS
ncbi:retinitis pigmentosa 1-like 1 protein [Clarias gariepinus]